MDEPHLEPFAYKKIYDDIILGQLMFCKVLPFLGSHKKES